VLLLGPDDVSGRHAALLLDLAAFSSQCQTCCNYAMQENLEDKSEQQKLAKTGLDMLELTAVKSSCWLGMLLYIQTRL